MLNSSDRETMEKRLQSIKKTYRQIGRFIDELPDAVPFVKKFFQDKVLGDKDLNNLMDAIENNRPPRFLMVGRTGVGKSSLINAMFGEYLAQVSDTESCTADFNICSYKDRTGETRMEILDTRGIAESSQLDSRQSAEDRLLKGISEFSPDAAILVLSCVHRDSVNDDADFLKEVIKKYEKTNAALPVIVVCTRADGVPPYEVPYKPKKFDNIARIVENYKKVLTNHGLKIFEILAVSSYIEWKTVDGREVYAEEINSMSKEEISELQIGVDGTYNIKELFDTLDRAIVDFRAKINLRMAVQLDEFAKRFARQIANIIASIGSSVSLTPIPCSDIYILLALQALLVMIIAGLSGRDINMKTAGEFVISLLGLGGTGVGFRLAAQQFSKLIPAGGVAISAVLSWTGTKLVGEAAIAYYIEQKSKEETKAQFNRGGLFNGILKKSDTPTA